MQLVVRSPFVGRALWLTALWTALFGAAFSVQAGTAPSTYSAYTGTDTKTIPSPPALGPANSVANDPTYGTPVLRVTDQNTKGGDSFISTDAGFHRAWNANSTAIKLTGPYGDGYWLEFNPSTFQVGDGTSQPAPHPLSFGATWEWSAVNPDIIYFLNGSQIAQYNITNGAVTNLGGPSNGDPVQYMAVVIGQDNWVCSAAGDGEQNTYTEIYCVNPSNPSVSEFINILNKTINGVPQSTSSWPTSASGTVIGIHDVAGGTGANWLEVTFANDSWGANGGAVYNLSTNTWSFVTNADPYWSGHVSMGNGVYVNSSGSVNGEDSRGMVERNPNNLMTSADYLFFGQPPTSPGNGWCDADHNSWFNSAGNPTAPVFFSRYTIDTPCAFAWAGEIDAAAVDGSNTVWRFANNFSNGSNCYYGESFAQVSNDGNWVLFSSYWGGTLGPDTAFGCQTRIDTFIVNLSAGATSDPPSIPPAPAGLAATAGNAQVALSWAASSGATSYSVYRSTTSGSGYAAVATGLTATSYTNTGLSNGTAYYYVVTASNSAGQSGYSSQASATPTDPVTIPAAPTSLTATAGDAQVALSWAASSGATSYSVYRSSTSGSGYSSIATGLTATSYTNTGLTDGTTYYYVVPASNSAGQSGYSSQASATPTDPPGGTGNGTGSQVLLQIQGNLAEVSGVTNGSVVTPSTAPAGFTGTVEVNGSGSVNFAPAQTGNGVYFLNCCSNTNQAYYKFTGATVGSIFNASQGQISFSLQSRYSFAQREANAAAQRYAFDVRDGNGVHQFYFLTQVLSGRLIFTYLMGGTDDYYYVPLGTENALYGDGVNLQVTLSWGGGTASLSLNGTVVQSFPYTPLTPAWTASSLLDLGAIEYLSYGGYNVSDDIINQFTVTGSSTGSSETAAPVVAITAPANGAVLSGTVTVTTNATSNLGISGVQLQLDGSSLGGVLSGAGPSYSHSWNTLQTANGSHTLTAVATDAEGNSSTSSSVTVTVNNSLTGPQVLLQIQGNLAEVSGVTNGSVVTPSTAPAGFTGTVEVNGSGSVNFAPAQTGNGVYFLNCCSNTNQAYYKFTGATVGSIFNASQGQISFSLQSRYSFAQREANAAAQRYAFDVRDGNGVHQFYFLTQVLSGRLIFTYLMGGTDDYYYVPLGTENALYGDGVNLQVTLSWGGGTASLSLNGTVVQSFPYTPLTPAWTASSLLDLGAIEYLSYGGYNVSDDIINQFTVTTQ